MDDRGGKVDHRFETCVRFVAAHGDAFELFEFAEEVFDQMPPFVDFQIDIERLGASGVLRDDDFRATFVHVCDNPIRIKSLIGDEAAKFDVVDQRRHAGRVVALPRQQNKTHQIAERVRERENLGRQATLGLAYGLALSPPFAPCPWR